MKPILTDEYCKPSSGYNVKENSLENNELTKASGQRIGLAKVVYFFDRDLSKTAHELYALISELGECPFSNEELRDMLGGHSVRSIQLNLAKLESKGYLSRSTRQHCDRRRRRLLRINIKVNTHENHFTQGPSRNTFHETDNMREFSQPKRDSSESKAAKGDIYKINKLKTLKYDSKSPIDPPSSVTEVLGVMRELSEQRSELKLGEETLKQEAERFFEYYRVRDWHQSNGRRVRNWRFNLRNWLHNHRDWRQQANKQNSAQPTYKASTQVKQGPPPPQAKPAPIPPPLTPEERAEAAKAKKICMEQLKAKWKRKPLPDEEALKDNGKMENIKACGFQKINESIPLSLKYRS